MITLASRIMQQMLDVNRYAALPFVETGKHNDARLWLAGLRQRLDSLLADVDRATLDVASLSPSEGEHWTHGEQLAFGEWLVQTYPNEHSSAVIALGDAWKDGKRFGMATASGQPIGDNRTATSIHGLVDATGQLTPSGKALASAIASAVAGAPAPSAVTA
ncbi:hypothetical protein [Paraburkholderia phenazinium]|uniref:hypothetical protein n=1 Tax=Paraburkholderia phenazinium TaxID=60549 RepID=UPI0015889E8F|nr:hypothetical protein [Paraburkholderia phenazinium]